MSTIGDSQPGVCRVLSVEEKLADWEAERDLQFTRRTAVYVSTPITTGRRFIEWLWTTGQHFNKHSEEYQRALRADVILPNTQRAARFIELLRWRHMGLIIDPTSLDVPGWTQSDYHGFWTSVIDRHARRVIFLKGWEFSRGCTVEFETAQRLGIDCVEENLEPLSREKGLQLIESAIEEAKQVGVDTAPFEEVCQRLRREVAPLVSVDRKLYKDEVLDHLAWTANVAQFVSFAPGPRLEQRFCRVLGYEPNHRFPSPEAAIRALLESSLEGTVNIRSYDPLRPEGNPFLRGLSSLDEVITNLSRLAGEERLYTIVNETIDEHDGGVSGVCYRGLIEFSPDANPRCVDDEEIDTAVFPFELGMRVLTSVYGLEPDLRGREGARVEFSIHPRPRGWNQAHTIIWQSEQRPAAELKAKVRWPHRFSRLLGDKAFGLTVAAAIGLSVPRTMVFSRRLFPYMFGRPTGKEAVWTRTCAEVKEPGYYPSARGWHDPDAVLEGRILRPAARKTQAPPPPLASVLIQQAVPAMYSGRAILEERDGIEVRGVRGEGDAFMLGEQAHGPLPERTVQAVRHTYRIAYEAVGPIGIEWVFDGNTVWIVQLNAATSPRPSVERDASREWVEFRFAKGRLEDFRREVMALCGTNKGIIVVGRVSPLSHLGEIAEVHGVPVRFSPV
ncbi:MAG: hypothetical protein ACE5JI_00955 [Acidobacteriota bacterium]